MKEVWKDIKGWEGLYRISNKGRVFSIRKKIMLKPYSKEGGYLRVKLCRIFKFKWYLISRLIAIAFIPNPLNKRTVNHKDGIKTNNNITNLEWNSHSENCKHSFIIGLQKPQQGENHPNHKLTTVDVLQIRKLFPNDMGYTQVDIAKIFNVKKVTISRIVRRQGWQHI